MHQIVKHVSVCLCPSHHGKQKVLVIWRDTILNVERKKSSFVVGPNLVKVRGITNVLSGVFGDLFSNPW